MKRYFRSIGQKMKPNVHWFLNNEGINFLISLLVLIFALIIVIDRKSIHMDWIDYTVFLTVFLALFVNFASIFINRLLIRHLEDDMKLTNDYDGLASKYDANFITFDNEHDTDVNFKNFNKLKKLKDGKIKITFPVILDIDLYGKETTIQDNPKEQYVLPEEVQREYGHIFKAHATSKIYNQLNIRVNDWKEEAGRAVICTGRTTYFDSLATNRAMDYTWSTGVTNRDIYGYGPFVPDLADSKLSNHIGFNGFIESKDGCIAFIKRGKNLSIAKGTYATSVGASLKVKYALNDDKVFTIEGLMNGILQEIDDELKLKESDLEDFNEKKSIIAAYRDLVEGGKPQLLVYVKSNRTKEEIEANFKIINRNKRKNKLHNKNVESDLMVDGNKFIWIHKNDIKKLAISSEYMIHKGKEYNMVPSAAASVVMLRNHLLRVRVPGTARKSRFSDIRY